MNWHPTYASVLFDLNIEVVDADALEALVEIHTFDKVCRQTIVK